MEILTDVWVKNWTEKDIVCALNRTPFLGGQNGVKNVRNCPLNV